MKIRPDPHCPACHGSGTVSDSVDIGSTTATLESTCDCILSQVPEDHDESDIEIVRTDE